MDFFKPGGNYPVGYSVSTVAKLVPIILAVVILVLIFKYRDRVKDENFRYVLIEKVILGMLIFAQLGSWFVTIAYGKGPYIGFYFENLPFHLCSVTLIGLIYIYITKDNKLFKKFFHVGIMGGLLGMVFSTTNVGPLNFEYYRFFLAHMYIIIGYVYYYYRYEIRFESDDIISAFKLIFLLFIISLVVNIVMHTAFFYVGPRAYNDISIFQIVPHWTIATTIVLILITLFYIVIYKFFGGKTFFKDISV